MIVPKKKSVIWLSTLDTYDTRIFQGMDLTNKTIIKLKLIKQKNASPGIILFYCNFMKIILVSITWYVNAQNMIELLARGIKSWCAIIVSY